MGGWRYFVSTILSISRLRDQGLLGRGSSFQLCLGARLSRFVHNQSACLMQFYFAFVPVLSVWCPFTLAGGSVFQASLYSYSILASLAQAHGASKAEFVVALLTLVLTVFASVLPGWCSSAQAGGLVFQLKASCMACTPFRVRGLRHRVGAADRGGRPLPLSG